MQARKDTDTLTADGLYCPSEDFTLKVRASDEGVIELILTSGNDSKVYGFEPHEAAHIGTVFSHASVNGRLIRQAKAA